MLPLAQVVQNVVFAGANMRAQDANGLRRIAPLHGFDQLEMLLVGGEASCRIVEAVGSSFQNNAFEYLSQRAQQSLVAGNPGDVQVQILIVDQTLARKAPPLHVRTV